MLAIANGVFNMSPDEKKMILNQISIVSARLEQSLKLLANSSKYGLHKGKPIGIAETVLNNCDELAEALSIYLSDKFTLSDIQDYHD